jgi:hypothetical protein
MAPREKLTDRKKALAPAGRRVNKEVTQFPPAHCLADVENALAASDAQKEALLRQISAEHVGKFMQTRKAGVMKPVVSHKESGEAAYEKPQEKEKLLHAPPLPNASFD